MKIVWSDYCGKCGRENKGEIHRLKDCFYCSKEARDRGFAQHKHHEFVRVPLNFNEWAKAQAKKLWEIRELHSEPKVIRTIQEVGYELENVCEKEG